jgi:diaminohydroxyphosphoribosylaminopyrimidine deaminase/5-amino-6-(5-phosphoribosylamino)uracil reductase
MRLALAQARRASGRSFPNPPVGAVIFRGDRVLGRGFTRPAGQPHAEVVALRSALRRHGERALRGATLAVTLEPCNHHGRTGPCVDAIVRTGIARVFLGHTDPNPKVAGRGIRRLRAAGVAVDTGVCEAECRRQHRGFLSVQERGRPWVELKLAASLDGRIATASGESRWLSGARARAIVHRMRAECDAVMVGRATAAADDPELTARRSGRVVHRPVRVLVDGGLRAPGRLKLFRDHPERTWVLCARDAPVARREGLRRAGVRVLPVARRGAWIDLAAGLRVLAAHGLTRILVEGGGGLAAALLRGGLVDELHWFVAPVLLGGDARAAVADLALRRLDRAPRLVDAAVRRIGTDVHIHGRLDGARRGRGARRA